MAKVEVIMPDGLEKKLATLGRDTDRIVAASLEEGAKPIYKAVLEAYDAVTPHPLVVRGRRVYNYGIRSTGTLRRSIGISPVKVNRKGDHDIKIGFGDVKEPKTRIRCGYLAVIIERGVLHGRRKQPPRPFLKVAKRMSKEEASAAFVKRFNEEVARL